MTTTTTNPGDILTLKQKQTELDALIQEYNTLHASYLRDVSTNIVMQWAIKYPVQISGNLESDIISPAIPFSPTDTSANCFQLCQNDVNCGFALFSNSPAPNRCNLYKSNPETRMIESQAAACGGTNQPACTDASRNYYGYEKPMWENKPFTNAMSTTTPPLGEAGKNLGTDWIYLGTAESLPQCQEAAMKNENVFTKIVYINDNTPGRLQWNKSCYGNTVGGASYGTNTAPIEYTTSIPPYGYTKLGINAGGSTADQLTKIKRMNQLRKKIDEKNAEVQSLMNSIFGNRMKYIDSLRDPQSGKIGTATTANKLSSYLFDTNNGIYSKLSKARGSNDETQDNINLYDEINSQVSVKSTQYRYVVVILIAFVMVSAILSIMSPLSLDEQIARIMEMFQARWWTKWWIVLLTVSIILFSSLGWSFRDNFIAFFRLVTNPEYWLGDKWWVGVAVIFGLYFVYLYYTRFYRGSEFANKMSTAFT
jgi:hypothetical protein